MKIVGFGDSFIVDTPTYGEDYSWCYQTVLDNCYGVRPEFRGLAGSGPWNMFFDFINYKEPIDVAIMAWSEPGRLYHPEVQPINTHNSRKENITAPSPFREVYEAAGEFYKYVFDHDKANYELQALMLMFDEVTCKKYPNTKFIHMHCFPHTHRSIWWGNLFPKINDHSQLEYFHIFKNGMNIHPVLSWYSMKDEGRPKHMVDDRRACHLNKRNHGMVGRAIVDCIQNYVPGKIVNIDHYEPN